MALLSPTFQIDLRRFCSGGEGLVLQQIDDMFQGAGIEFGPPETGQSGGARQKQAQRYLSTIDWDSEADVGKVLQAVTIALSTDSTSPEHKKKLRALCEKEGLQIQGDRVVLAGGAVRTTEPRAGTAARDERESSMPEIELFVSWSKSRSRQAAETIKEWLPNALPGVKPWMSKEDITKGTTWFNAISDQLARSGACLICVTPENIQSAWLFYEAGAIAHAMRGALVCPYLIGVKPSDLAGTPLGQYQATVFEKNDTHLLIRSLNERLKPPHDEKLVRTAFNGSWGALKRKLTKVVTLVTTPPPADKPDNPNELDLSDEARHVLVEASKDAQGSVGMTKTMHGFHLTSRGMQLVDGGNPRIEAAYREGVNDLVTRRLLEARGEKGESFALTKRGWSVADKLRQAAPAQTNGGGV
jgi:hypothetical protein